MLTSQHNIHWWTDVDSTTCQVSRLAEETRGFGPARVSRWGSGAGIQPTVFGHSLQQAIVQGEAGQPEARLSGGDVRHTSADFALPVGRALTARKVRG